MGKVSEEQLNQYAVFQPKYCNPGGATGRGRSYGRIFLPPVDAKIF